MAVTMPLFWMKSICCWKMEAGSLSNPTMKPPCTWRPARCSRFTLSTRSRPLFWFLLHSARLSSFGVSMPTKTVSKPASTISLSSTGSSARLMEASVLNGMPVLPLRHSIRAGSTSVLMCFLLPMKLSSTKKMLLRQPSGVQAVQLGDDLRGGLGTRAMTQQRRHVAEVAVEGAAARELDADRVVILEIRHAPKRDGGLVDIGVFRRGIDALSPALLQVAQERRQSHLGLVQHKVVDVRELLVFHREERSAGHHLDAGSLAAVDDEAGPILAARSWR